MFKLKLVKTEDDKLVQENKRLKADIASLKSNQKIEDYENKHMLKMTQELNELKFREKKINTDESVVSLDKEIQYLKHTLEVEREFHKSQIDTINNNNSKLSDKDTTYRYSIQDIQNKQLEMVKSLIEGFTSKLPDVNITELPKVEITNKN